MADINGAPAHIKLYNLPQRVKGGIKIHGFVIDGKEVPLRFHHLDGMYSYCTVEDSEKVVHLNASTPLVELGNNEYRIEEEPDESK